MEAGIPVEVTTRLRPRLAGAIGAGDAKVPSAWMLCLTSKHKRVFVTHILRIAGGRREHRAIAQGERSARPSG